MRRIDCSHSRILKMLPWSWFREYVYWSENRKSWSGKHSQASRMRAIDSLHKITLRKIILGQETQNFRFSLQYIHLFPWIRIKEAFSRFRNASNRFFAWNYSQKYNFEGEISNFFDFHFNTHIYFPESGSRKHFQALRMRAIDFSHDFTPI
jgi:hypothetical protein